MKNLRHRPRCVRVRVSVRACVCVRERERVAGKRHSLPSKLRARATSSIDGITDERKIIKDNFRRASVIKRQLAGRGETVVIVIILVKFYTRVRVILSVEFVKQVAESGT